MIKEIKEPEFELRIDIAEIYFKGKTGELRLQQEKINEYVLKAEDSTLHELYTILKKRPELRLYNKNVDCSPDYDQIPLETDFDFLEKSVELAYVSEWLFSKNTIM